MKHLSLLMIICLTGCCGTRFEENTSQLLKKRIETNNATVELARKSDQATATKLYEDAIKRSSAQLQRIANIIDGDTTAEGASSGTEAGSK
jgi:hypothetical protein